MKSIELFSGAGGLAKGLEIAGFDHVSFVEYNKHACASLRLNFPPEKVFEGDIRDFNLSKLHTIDLVAGGPPCQPFSLGGKHKANNDDRDMFPYAIKAIEKLKPKAFIFENVKGLLRPSFSEYFSYIILRLTYPDFSIKHERWQDNLMDLRAINPAIYQGTKYDVNYELINAANYGVPQTRERVIIVGTRLDLNKKWKFPKPTHSEDKLLWDQLISNQYWKKHKLAMPENFTTTLSAKSKIDKLRQKYGTKPPKIEAWQTIRDAIKGIPEPHLNHSIVDHVLKTGAKIYPGHTGSEIDWPSKTIKAGGHGVPGGENMIKFSDGTVRYFTVYEAKILQTFPKDFMVSGAWGEAMRQIGNAVPILLAEKIGSCLHALILEDINGSKAA